MPGRLSSSPVLYVNQLVDSKSSKKVFAVILRKVLFITGAYKLIPWRIKPSR